MTMLQHNRTYKTFSPCGVVLHETANPEATAQNHFNYFNKAELPAGKRANAHAFVDWNELVQCVPYDERGMHAGQTANKKYIGVEMCNTSDPAKFEIVYQNTLNLISDLFIQYDWGYCDNNNLMSHNEVSKKWGETNHTDPTAYFKKFGKTIDIFRTDLNIMLFNKKGQKILYGEVVEKMVIDNALKILVDKGIIDSPEFWKGACNYEINLDLFIIKIATYIRDNTK